MSDRTKFFAEKNARAKNAADQRQREGKEVRKQQEEEHASFVRAAAIYEPLFEKFATELRGEGIRTAITKESKVINAADADTREEYAGNVFLALTFHAGETNYELVYLGATRPGGLGMLAWRRNNDRTYFVGPQSKASPTTLLEMVHVAEHHVNQAIQAMQTG